MEKMQFETQMQRLRDQWPAAYSNERMKLLWLAFKDMNYNDFQDAISELLMTQRSAPLLEEISKATQLAKNRYYERLRTKEASVLGMMQQAANVNTVADSAFVEDCLNLVEELYSKKITYAEFQQKCDLLSAAAKHFAKQKGYAMAEPGPSNNLPKIYNPSDD